MTNAKWFSKNVPKVLTEYNTHYVYVLDSTYMILDSSMGSSKLNMTHQ